MAGIPFQSFLSSKPWKVIGPNKSVYYAHNELVAQVSTVLHKDVTGKTKERESKTIAIDDVDDDLDDDTVMRFIEYAYTGDYIVPPPDVLQLVADPDLIVEAFVPSNTRGDGPSVDLFSESAADHIDEVDEWAVPTSKSFKKDKKKKRILAHNLWFDDSPAEVLLEAPIETQATNVTLTDPFTSSNGTQSSRRSLWEKFCSQASIVEPQPWKSSADNDSRDDFTQVFLCHARLYKFSERYDCPDLMTLSLRKLRLTMSSYQWHQERACAIVELLRYTYKHTMDYEQGHDKLRSLVLDYAICYVKQLSLEPEYLDLLEHRGKLAADMCKKMVDLID